MRVIHCKEDNFDVYWKDGLKNIPGATPMYSTGVRKFEHEIFSSSLLRDDSFAVLTDSGEIAALVPLYCFKNESGLSEYRYAGEYLRAPLLYGLPDSDKYKKMQKFVFERIEELARLNNVMAHKTMTEGVDILEGRHYYNYLTDFGYNDESSVCQLIDCSKDINGLWTDVRKSYKHLINRADKNYLYETVSSHNYNFEKCENYRKLHLKAAGKQTRSLESFYLMYKMIENNQAFIILVRDKVEHTVAAHFFYHLGAHCLYASSAVDPELPSDSGIGHLALWQGIVTACNMGIRFFDMGQLRIASDFTEKEMGIAVFKKGFGGRTVSVFRGTKVFV